MSVSVLSPPPNPQEEGGRKGAGSPVAGGGGNALLCVKIDRVASKQEQFPSLKPHMTSPFRGGGVVVVVSASLWSPWLSPRQPNILGSGLGGGGGRGMQTTVNRKAKRERERRLQMQSQERLQLHHTPPPSTAAVGGKQAVNSTQRDTHSRDDTRTHTQLK